MMASGSFMAVGLSSQGSPSNPEVLEGSWWDTVAGDGGALTHRPFVCSVFSLIERIVTFMPPKCRGTVVNGSFQLVKATL